MKKVCIKILTCMLIALCLVTTISACIPVSAATGIAPYSNYENNFSFTGSCGISRDFTGMFMDVKVKGTADNNNNETITLEVYIRSRNITKTYTFLTDGKYHTYNNIYLGLSGTEVFFTFTGANPAIKINMYMQATS